MSGRLRRALVFSALATLCFFRPCAVSAGVEIIVPVGASASSSYAASYSPQMLINGSGLTGTGREATHTTENIPYVTWNSNLSVPAAGQWVEFDLGATYDVTNALIWQLATAGYTSSGVRDYTISVAGPDQIFTTYPSGTLTLAQAADPSTGEPVQVVSLVAQNIRYIKLNIQSNWGGTSGVSLGEVRFEGVLSGVPIIQPVSATASTSHPDADGYWPQFLIDGSGLTGTGREATHTNTNLPSLFWHSAVGVDVTYQWVEFDLGAPYDVKNALIWQLAQNVAPDRGVQYFKISVAGSDHILSTYSAGNLLNIATGLPDEPVQVVPLMASNIRYIRFTVQSNWGSTQGIVGLSEVRFEGTLTAPPAPDPILVPVAASASSSYDYQNHYTPQWLISGGGLTGFGRGATHSNADGWNLFWHTSLYAISGEWVEFDLGTTCDVTNALIWQLDQAGGTGRGVQDFTIDVAGSDHVFTPYPAGTLKLARATGAPETPVQVVPLVASNIRYVRFNILSNWGDSIVVGLGEVRFEGAPTEPHSTDLILAPVGATALTSHPDGDGYWPRYLIDGSGLSGLGRSATHTDAGAVNLFWHSAVGVDVSQQWVEFDLGMPYDVANALIWQLAQENFTTRGVYAFTIKVAGPDYLFSTYSVNNWLNQATGLPNEPVQVVPLVANNVRYVRFEIQSNWGSTQGIVGLSEVRFAVKYEAVTPETEGHIRIPVATAASSSYSANPPGYLIDGSGLAGAGLAATHADGLGQNSMWLSDGGAITNQWLEFDFGMEMKLVAAALWQYNQTATNSGQPFDYTGRGVRGMTIFTAGNDKIYTEYGGVRLAGARGLAAEPVQLVPLTADRVRYVKFAINSNWGYDSYVGLSEVRFLFKKTGMIICIH